MGQASGSEPLGAVVHLSALGIFFFFAFYLFFLIKFLFLAVLGLFATSGGYALVLVAVASLVAEYGL